MDGPLLNTNELVHQSIKTTRPHPVDDLRPVAGKGVLHIRHVPFFIPGIETPQSILGRNLSDSGLLDDYPIEKDGLKQVTALASFLGKHRELFKGLKGVLRM
ncbi:MAG: hypothetical protein Q9171_006460 [Xanthocarpia ochracea]